MELIFGDTCGGAGIKKVFAGADELFVQTAQEFLEFFHLFSGTAEVGVSLGSCFAGLFQLCGNGFSLCLGLPCLFGGVAGAEKFFAAPEFSFEAFSFFFPRFSETAAAFEKGFQFAVQCQPGALEFALFPSKLRLRGSVFAESLDPCFKFR